MSLVASPTARPPAHVRLAPAAAGSVAWDLTAKEGADLLSLVGALPQESGSPAQLSQACLVVDVEDPGTGDVVELEVRSRSVRSETLTLGGFLFDDESTDEADPLDDDTGRYYRDASGQVADWLVRSARGHVDAAAIARVREVLRSAK